MKLKQIHSLNEIPASSRIGIYGCGETGKSLYSLIREYRKDIKIDCFIDSKICLNMFGLDVLKYDKSSLERIDSLDIVIIASAFWSLIYKRLRPSTLKNCIILSSSFIYENSELSKLGDFYFNQLEIDKIRSEFDSIAEKFEIKSEIDLFKQLIHLRCDSGPYAPEYFVNYEVSKGQYVDFGMVNFNNNIIEAGAFDGADTVRISENSPRAHIYSFEPFPEMLKNGPYYEKICSNKNITIIEKALDEFTGKVYFKKNGSQSSKSDGVDSSHSNVLEAVTLDDFVDSRNIGRLDYIKMDIEGGEVSALRGAAFTIKKHRPIIAVSLYHRKQDFYEIPTLMNDLLGDFKLRLGHYTSSFIDSVLYVIPE